MSAKYTDKKLIKAWRMYNINNKTYTEIGEKLKVSKEAPRRWCSMVDNDPKLLALAKAKTKVKEVGNKKTSTKSALVRGWLIKHQKTISANGLYKKFLEDTGMEVAPSLFSTVKRKILHKHGLMKSKNNKAPRKNGIKLQVKNNNLLLDENAFLKWWNAGERKGYVERLLRETSNES